MKHSNFAKFLREMATKAPDSVQIWKEAKTPQEKEIAKRVIRANAKKKALLRDEIIGFIRTLSLENLRYVHKATFDIHTGQVLVSLVSKRSKQ